MPSPLMPFPRRQLRTPLGVNNERPKRRDSAARRYANARGSRFYAAAKCRLSENGRIKRKIYSAKSFPTEIFRHNALRPRLLMTKPAPTLTTLAAFIVPPPGRLDSAPNSTPLTLALPVPPGHLMKGRRREVTAAMGRTRRWGIAYAGHRAA